MVIQRESGLSWVYLAVLCFGPSPLGFFFFPTLTLSAPLTSQQNTHSSHLSRPAAAAASIAAVLQLPPLSFPVPSCSSLPAALPLFLAAAAAGAQAADASDVASLVEKAQAKLSPKMVGKAKDPKRKAKS